LYDDLSCDNNNNSGTTNRKAISITSNRIPHNRQHALLYHDNDNNNDRMLLKWQENQWLHKENFVCSFIQPQLLRYYRAQYWEEDTDISASPEEDDNVVKENNKLPVVSTIYLELYDCRSQQRVFGPICLDTNRGSQSVRILCDIIIVTTTCSTTTTIILPNRRGYELQSFFL
jgi:hypothetical protein